MIIAAAGWLLVSLLGSLPFYLIALKLSDQPGTPQTVLYFTQPINALFESVSGYTSTGLTMTFHPSELPRTLQWWRSFTEWIGGVGVIVLMLSIISGPGPRFWSLYYAEARQEKIHPSIRSTVRTIWWIFILYTVGSILLLQVAGMPWWDAINHAMAGIATGGFTVTDRSIASYGSLWIELALLSIMLFGAISFAVHYQLLHGRKVRVLWEDQQTCWLLALLLFGVFLLSLEEILQLEPLPAIRAAAFQFTSALTCTGFQTVDLHGWSATAKLILAAGMTVGGAAGSTAGGIKVIRLMILAKGIGWRLKRLISAPNVLVRFRLGGTSFDDAEASQRIIDAALIAALWLFFLAVGVVVLLHTVPESFGLSDIIFEVASAQSNVGLSTGITGPEMATAAKLVICFNMWIGRLEIIPVLLFLRAIFARID
jgi:trk system potassium uptake protein TrkH